MTKLICSISFPKGNGGGFPHPHRLVTFNRTQVTLCDLPMMVANTEPHPTDDSDPGREHTDWEEALWRNQGFSQVAVVPTVYRLAWLLGVRDYMEEGHRSST